MKQFLLICIACLPLLMSAQRKVDDGQPKYKEDKVGTFKAGLIVGANGAQVDGDGFAGYTKLGLNLGGRMMIVLHEHWQPGFELLYNQKGSQTTLETSIGPLQYKYSLDYISIPLMMNYVDRRVQFTAGAAYNQLVKAKVKDAGIDDPLIAEGFKKVDISLLAGMTFYLDVNKHIAANARFEYSLMDAYAGGLKFPGQDNSRLIRQTNKLVTVRLMYMF